MQRIRFADADPAGVAYFPVILSYCHGVFEDFFGEALGVPYRDVLKIHDIGFPIVHVDVDYRHPLRFGDDVEIQLFIEHLGRSSVRCRYEVSPPVQDSAEGSLSAVTCNMVNATIAVDGFQGIPMPDALREMLLPWVWSGK